MAANIHMFVAEHEVEIRYAKQSKWVLFTIQTT